MAVVPAPAGCKVILQDPVATAKPAVDVKLEVLPKEIVPDPACNVRSPVVVDHVEAEPAVKVKAPPDVKLEAPVGVRRTDPAPLAVKFPEVRVRAILVEPDVVIPPPLL